jgi:hypothetical protein
VTGWILLHLLDAAVGLEGAPLSGEWDLHALVEPDDGLLVVSLYPGAADTGCFLGGALIAGGPARKMAYAGTWHDESMTGPRFSGTFQAKQ